MTDADVLQECKSLASVRVELSFAMLIHHSREYFKWALSLEQLFKHQYCTRLSASVGILCVPEHDEVIV